MLLFAHIPFVVNRAFNATTTEWLQHQKLIFLEIPDTDGKTCVDVNGFKGFAVFVLSLQAVYTSLVGGAGKAKLWQKVRNSIFDRKPGPASKPCSSKETSMRWSAFKVNNICCCFVVKDLCFHANPVFPHRFRFLR